MQKLHEPVLLREVLGLLPTGLHRRAIDATLGLGGHSEALLQTGTAVLGLDRDPEALALASERLATFGERFAARRANFAQLREAHTDLGWPAVDGVLLDLGVSSIQLDRQHRGFSFRLDGPLDMRMDPDAEVRALDLVRGLSEKDLADLLYRFGEEHRSRAIARVLVRARKSHGLDSTREVAELITRAVGGRRQKIHPATKSFQALRIAVNAELDSLRMALDAVSDVLAPGGRMAVISFHSLEDRMVKNSFRQRKKEEGWKLLSKKPIRPSPGELTTNPRSRSARLRVIEKVITSAC